MVNRNGRRLVVVSCLAAALAAAPGAARAWNAAAHVYVAREQHRAAGAGAAAGALASRLYGANALDLFNGHFTPTWWTLQELLHAPLGTAPLAPWQVAGTELERAFAFGFASHGNGWGADSTAHVSGVTTGRGVGYVNAKAVLLAPILGPVLVENGLPLPDETLLLVSHILVEQAVDLLLVARDPALPALVMETALARDAAIPELLVRAFADGFAPYVEGGASADLIRAAEGELQWSLAAYGWALGQPDARTLVAGGIGAQAEEFLELPAGAGAALVPLIEWAVAEAEALCRADFARELAATAGWVGGRLAAAGVAP